MAFPSKVAEKLAYNSAYICNYPGCNTLTVGPTASNKHLAKKIGEAAHMEGEGLKSARHNKANQATVQDISNGIWLCANCHTMIDKNDGADFPLHELQSWKAEHEMLISSLLRMHKSPLPLIRRNSLNQKTAQNAIDLVADCGALFQAKNYEDPLLIIQSIGALRKSLGAELKKVQDDKQLRSLIQEMQGGCRELMNLSSTDMNIIWPSLLVVRYKVLKAVKSLSNDFGCQIPAQITY